MTLRRGWWNDTVESPYSVRMTILEAHARKKKMGVQGQRVAIIPEKRARAVDPVDCCELNSMAETGCGA